MNIMVWLLIGGCIGWAASTSMGTGDRQSLALNIVIGATGAFLGGWLLSSVIDADTANQTALAVSKLGVSLLGAVLLLVFAKLARLA